MMQCILLCNLACDNVKPTMDNGYDIINKLHVCNTSHFVLKVFDKAQKKKNSLSQLPLAKKLCAVLFFCYKNKLCPM